MALVDRLATTDERDDAVQALQTNMRESFDQAFAAQAAGVTLRRNALARRHHSARCGRSLRRAQATGHLIHAGFTPGIDAHLPACRRGTSIAAPIG